MFMKYHIACAALALLSSAPAFAQEEPAGPVTVTGSVVLVSDYRFRGVSQSDRGMAIQGGLTATHESGLYEIGRASCRARLWQSVENSVVAVSLKKKTSRSPT